MELIVHRWLGLVAAIAMAASCTGAIGESPPAGSGGAGGGGAGGGSGGVDLSCADVGDCDDGEPCTVDSCDLDTLTCVFEPVPDALLEEDPTPGDCAKAACIGGVTTRHPDDVDIPEDDNPCTIDVCTDGVPANPPTAGGTECGVDLVCDGMGVCTGCATGADCPQPSGICEAATCIDGNCGVGVAPDGTPCPSNGVFCDGAEECQGGACVPPGDPCDGPDGDGDCSEMCDESSNSCTGNDPKDSPCNDGLYCNGTDECNPQGSCTQHNNPPCGTVFDSNCLVGCDEANDVCTTYEPAGSYCSDGLWCNGSDSCNSSGSCSNHTGNPCPGADGDADCSETCNESSNSCTANDPNGTDCNGIPDTICCLNGACTTSTGCN